MIWYTVFFFTLVGNFILGKLTYEVEKIMRILLKTLIILYITIGSFQNARGQSVDLNGEIFEYATYYVNSFDLGTGATNVQIFRYQLSSNDYPVSIKVRFKGFNAITSSWY